MVRTPDTPFGSAGVPNAEVRHGLEIRGTEIDSLPFHMKTSMLYLLSNVLMQNSHNFLPMLAVLKNSSDRIP